MEMPKQSQVKQFRRGHGEKNMAPKSFRSFWTQQLTTWPGWISMLFIRFTRLKQASHIVPSGLHLDVQACQKKKNGTEAKGQTRNMLTSEGQNHKDKQPTQQQPYISTAESRNQCFPLLFWPKFITAAFVSLVSCHSSVIALPRF